MAVGDAMHAGAHDLLANNCGVPIYGDPAMLLTPESIVLYILALLWLLYGMKIVSEDYLAECVNGLVERYNIPHSVAGSTLMAVCASTPELFSSFIGTFITAERSVTLDGIPGLVPGLVPGIQGSKSPGSLGQTWDWAKSLNFILIDSNFLLSPCPETRCHARCFPVFFKDFSEGKNICFETPSPGLPRGKADGGCNRVPLACPEL